MLIIVYLHHIIQTWCYCINHAFDSAFPRYFHGMITGWCHREIMWDPLHIVEFHCFIPEPPKNFTKKRGFKVQSAAAWLCEPIADIASWSFLWTHPGTTKAMGGLLPSQVCFGPNAGWRRKALGIAVNWIWDFIYTWHYAGWIWMIPWTYATYRYPFR